MKDLEKRFYKKMPDSNFCVDIFIKGNLKKGNILGSHWHEHMQIYWFTSGQAFLECGRKHFNVSKDSVVIINSSELHYMQSLSDDLQFYVIRIDPSFLFSNQVDLCQTKYISPLSQGLISFQNLIEDDPQISECIIEMIDEYFSREIGYELAVKSTIYRLIVFLLRKYVVKVLTNDEFNEKVNNLRRFDSVFKYINNNYADKISIRDLADIANISVYHFCRIFKEAAGKTATGYINGVRLEKAANCLESNDLNITEVAMKCGFESINYFSRLFKKHYGVAPTEFRKLKTQ